MLANAGRSFSNLRTWNWQNIIIVALAGFYITNFGYRAVTCPFPCYGQDYLAYWSVGKIAEEEGYSKIYDLKILRSVEAQELKKLNLIDPIKGPTFLTIPAPYLSVFLLPFQLLSHVQIQTSLTIWLMANFIVLVGYTLFFTKAVWKIKSAKVPWLSSMVLALFSYTVFSNFAEGQINVFLLVCVGEFLRNSINGKPFSAGLWLGGLLLKPQLLVLIAPLMLFLGYWKPLKGFLVSSVTVLLTSWLLSGTIGMKALFAILTGFTSEMGIVAPQRMINWRMVGTYLNIWTNSSYGWIVTAIGMVTTLIVVIILARRKPEFGSPGWELLMLGTFAATLAFTWHAHITMAMVMIPFILAGIAGRIISKNVLSLWLLIPPATWILAGMVMSIIRAIFHLEIYSDPLSIAIAFSGFIANLVLLLSVALPAISIIKAHNETTD